VIDRAYMNRRRVGTPGAIAFSVAFMVLLSSSCAHREAQAEHPPLRAPSHLSVEPREEPVPLVQVEPAYPDAARQAHIRGVAMVEALVGVDGRIHEARVSRSDSPLFEEPALEAVRQWTFRPARINGKARAVWIAIPFRFPPEHRGTPPGLEM